MSVVMSGVLHTRDASSLRVTRGREGTFNLFFPLYFFIGLHSIKKSSLVFRNDATKIQKHKTWQEKNNHRGDKTCSWLKLIKVYVLLFNQGSYTFWPMDFQDFKPNFHEQNEIHECKYDLRDVCKFTVQKAKKGITRRCISVGIMLKWMKEWWTPFWFSRELFRKQFLRVINVIKNVLIWKMYVVVYINIFYFFILFIVFLLFYFLLYFILIFWFILISI